MIELNLISFGKSLFFGKTAWEKIFPFPETALKIPEDATMVIESMKKFFENNPKIDEIDKAGRISDEIMNPLKEMGLFGMIIPEEYGGCNFSQTTYARIMEYIASCEASLAATIGAHQSIGMKAILLFGNEEQKKKYLPDLATGKKVAAFALTEPTAGSDAAGIKTRAVPIENGKYFLLNGTKQWITNGGFAEVFTVFAKHNVIDKGVEKEKISAFIVERGMAGFSSGKEEVKLGIKGSSTTELHLEDVKVPAENLLGEAGKGFKIAMEVLNQGRLGLAAGCLGGSRKLYNLAMDHALTRKQFERPIYEFEMVKEKLARILAGIYSMESMVYLTSGLIDRGESDYSLESAACKIYCSEKTWEIVNEALQISGGNGYMADYPYEKALRDCRINLIFEGTNEILRAFIALAGFQYPGEYLKDLGKALQNPISQVGVLSEYVSNKVMTFFSQYKDYGEVVSNFFGRGEKDHHRKKSDNDFHDKVPERLHKDLHKIEKSVYKFSSKVEKLLRKHGKEIITQQMIQKRISEIFIDFYGMAAVFSRISTEIMNDGIEKHEKDLAIAKCYFTEARMRIKQNLKFIDSSGDKKKIALMDTIDKDFRYSH